MKLKPCKCGSTDVKLCLAMQVKTGKGVYCYQCQECGKTAYAWADSEDRAVEIWNDTMR